MNGRTKNRRAGHGQMLRRCSLIFSFLAAGLLAGCASGSGEADIEAQRAAIAAAIANPERTPEDIERDARSHPEVVLELLQISPGDTVADIFGGGGYYAELIAGVVRPDGEVILQNNAPYSKWVMKDLQAKYIDNTVPGIRVLLSEVDDLQLGTATLDAALMVMSFHDLYYVNPERGWGETDVALFLRQVHAALKPGGRFVVVDHAAAAGTGKNSVQELHRIDEDFVREQIERAGFRLTESSDVLRNPADDKSTMVFAKGVRGTTDRFVLAFTR